MVPLHRNCDTTGGALECTSNPLINKVLSFKYGSLRKRNSPLGQAFSP